MLSLTASTRPRAAVDRRQHASLELVAWELSIEESAVSAAWSRAIADGLLERSGTDEVPGEETWRLTTWGRRACEGSDDVST
jgi:DNA-binding HxlR family transcriptional regulator